MFLYYLPGGKTINAELKRELADVVDTWMWRETAQGPAGGGLLIGDKRDHTNATLVFDQPAQTWSKAYGRETWIGRYNETPQLPETLQRQKTIPGKPLRLLDGRDWLIPQLRSYVVNNDQIQFNDHLPRTVAQDPETGLMVEGDVTPQYRSLFDESVAIAESLWIQCQATESASLDDTRVNQFVGQVFALNYRMGAAELSAAALCDQTLWNEILAIAIDWDGLLVAAKNLAARTPAGDTATPSGDAPPTPGGDPDIDQPPANSTPG